MLDASTSLQRSRKALMFVVRQAWPELAEGPTTNPGIGSVLAPNYKTMLQT